MTLDDKENSGKKIPRRTMLRAAAVSAAAALMGASGVQRAPGAGQPAGSGTGNPGPATNANDTTQLYADPTKVTGTLPGKLGTRSPFEQPVKKPSDISSRTPLQDLYGIITPSDLHFERSHAGVPRIDPEKYELLIHGMVERPMVFSLRDLKRFPAASRIAFI
jgi:sulfane dehydrogenase subunit SoxC